MIKVTATIEAWLESKQDAENFLDGVAEHVDGLQSYGPESLHRVCFADESTIEVFPCDCPNCQEEREGESNDLG